MEPQAVTPGATPAPAAAAAPDGVPQPNPSPAAPAANASEPDGLKLSFKEWQDFRKEQRSQIAALEAKLAKVGAPGTEAKPTAAPAPDGDLASQVATLRRENALNRAFADHGIKPGKLRSFIESQAARLSPEDVGGFVASALEAYAPGATSGTAPAQSSPDPKTAPAAAPAAPAVRPPDTGPPGVSPASTLDFNPNRINPSIWAGLKPEERKQRLDAWLKSGTNNNWTRGSGKRSP